MERKLSSLTVSQAIEQNPRLLGALETMPLLRMSVEEAIKANENFAEWFSRDPLSAIVTGMAVNELKHRVGVYGYSETNAGIVGESKHGLAGRFIGKVSATDFSCTGEDCAEDFDMVEETADPGTVMVVGRGGALCPCSEGYDTKVAGVISGAGMFKPGIMLGRRDGVVGERRAPIALAGKVFCKVDASEQSIGPGTLLTTSMTLGHAMAVTDFAKARGCVIGKALGSLAGGKGLIPVLVSLQ